MSPPELVVLPSSDKLAANVAARTLDRLREVLEQRTRAALALTAGSIMESVWEQLAR